MLRVQLTLLALVPTFACQNGDHDDSSTTTSGEHDETSSDPTEPSTSESTAGEGTLLTACESSDADASSTADPPAETTGTPPSETSGDPGSSSDDTSSTAETSGAGESSSSTDDGGSSGACPAGVLPVPGHVEGTNVGQLDERHSGGAVHTTWSNGDRVVVGIIGYQDCAWCNANDDYPNTARRVNADTISWISYFKGLYP